MKKLLFVLAFFATIAFIGCSDDDNDDKIITSQIVGKWQLTRVVGYELYDGHKDEWDEDSTADNEIMVFNADGTGVMMDNEGDTDVFSYSFFEDILVITDDEQDKTSFTITKLTSSDMIHYQYVREKQGANDYYEFECTYYYVRK